MVHCGAEDVSIYSIHYRQSYSRKASRILTKSKYFSLPTHAKSKIPSKDWLFRQKEGKFWCLRSYRERGDAGKDAVGAELPLLRTILVASHLTDRFNFDEFGLFYT